MVRLCSPEHSIDFSLFAFRHTADTQAHRRLYDTWAETSGFPFNDSVPSVCAFYSVQLSIDVEPKTAADVVNSRSGEGGRGGTDRVAGEAGVHTARRPRKQ